MTDASVKTVLVTACALLTACSEPTVALWLGGDVHLGDGTPAALSALNPVTAGHLGFVNLEGPVRPTMPSGAGIRLHNSPAALASLGAADVRWVSIANNHALDAAKAGYEQTAKALRDLHLHPVGGPAGTHLGTSGELRVAWTAHDLSSTATAAVASAVQAASSNADIVVSSLHVTGPPSYLPRPGLVAAVDAVLAAGARVVAIHGSHALARVERRGERVIFWGLGNLLFACDCTSEEEAIVATLKVGKHGPPQVTLVPVRAGLGGRPAQLHDDSDGVLDLMQGIGTTLRGRKRGAGRL